MHSIESEAFSKKICGQAPLIVIDQNYLELAIANVSCTRYLYNFSNDLTKRTILIRIEKK